MPLISHTIMSQEKILIKKSDHHVFQKPRGRILHQKWINDLCQGSFYFLLVWFDQPGKAGIQIATSSLPRILSTLVREISLELYKKGEKMSLSSLEQDLPLILFAGWNIMETLSAKPQNKSYIIPFNKSNLVQTSLHIQNFSTGWMLENKSYMWEIFLTLLLRPYVCILSRMLTSLEQIVWCWH